MIATTILVRPNRPDSIGHMTECMPLVGIGPELTSFRSLGCLARCGSGSRGLFATIDTSSFLTREFTSGKCRANLRCEASKNETRGAVGVVHPSNGGVHVQPKFSIADPGREIKEEVKDYG